jgi:hypothetical protein
VDWFAAEEVGQGYGKSWVERVDRTLTGSSEFVTRQAAHRAHLAAAEAAASDRDDGRATPDFQPQAGNL